MDNIYLFVLSPPYQGSTILYKLLSTSPNISTFIGHSKNWKGEGQIFLKRNGMQEFFKNRWNKNINLNMQKIKKIFDKHWDQSKLIKCEKSPPTICRAKMFEDYFKKFGKVYFVCLIRDPYCSRWHEDADWITCANYIKNNIEELENKILITYEDLCDKTEEVIEKLIKFIPELKSLDKNVSHIDNMKGVRDLPITNMNKQKGLSQKKDILKCNKEIVEYFGYQIIE